MELKDIKDDDDVYAYLLKDGELCKSSDPMYRWGFLEALDLVKNLSLSGVSQQSELLLGFQKSEYFDLYEQGVLEYKDAIEKYLA